MKRDLNVILTVLAEGYEVSFEINSIDLCIKGRKSESVKLFGKESPNIPVLPPDMQQHVCLQEGDNSLKVKYRRVDEKGSPYLTIEMQSREQFVNGANFFAKKEKAELGESGEFSDIFTL